MNHSVGIWTLLTLWFVPWVQAATVFFPVTLTWENTTVAGATRPVILTNGQYPGPPLELNQGDDVQFEVTNLCPFSVTVHFHGIEQIGTPWSDGVPGVSQVPIQPNEKFLYRWRATQYGSYWYHAHHRGQLEDGLYGPIYIAPPSCAPKPFGLITQDVFQLQAMQLAEANTSPMMLSDWRLLTSEQIWNAEEASGVDAFCANALLINGKGSVTCFSQDQINAMTTENQRRVLGTENLTDIACLPPDLIPAQGNYPHNYSALLPTMFNGCTPSQGLQEVITVDPSVQYVSWDLISTAGLLHLLFSVDEHDMWVYAIDGRYIRPIRVNAINIPNASRYSVLVPLNKPAGDYSIRMVSGSAQQILNTTAILRYNAIPQLNRPSNPWVTITGQNATVNTIFLNDTTVVPYPAVTPSPTADDTYKLTIGRYNDSYRWTLGNDSYALQLEESEPLLFNQTSIPNDLIIRTKNNTWVDLIMQVNAPIQPAHPIHKHSNKHFVIGQGNGVFNYTTVAQAMTEIPASFNLVNPPYRDTTTTPPAVTRPTWLAIRYHVVNPGAFLMHCHIQIHQSGGMALAILDGVDAWPTIPWAYQDGHDGYGP